MTKNSKTSMWNEYEKERSHQLFKPYVPWSLKYPSNWWRNIKWFFRSFKYAYQRVRRGYSDYDLWDIGDYIIGLSAQALEDFSKKTHSYPDEYTKYNKKEDSDEGFDNWTQEIKECSSKLFLSLEALEEYNYETPEFPKEIVTERSKGLVTYTFPNKEIVEDWVNTLNEIAMDRRLQRREALLWFMDHSEELWS